MPVVSVAYTFVPSGERRRKIICGKKQKVEKKNMVGCKKTMDNSGSIRGAKKKLKIVTYTDERQLFTLNYGYLYLLFTNKVA